MAIPLGAMTLKTYVYTAIDNFHVNLKFSGTVVLEKKILKRFSYTNTGKNVSPYHNPTLSPGTII
jgi:hypothetical protein